MEEKKRKKTKGEKKRRGAEYGYRTRELRVGNLMASPPTTQRHELEIAFNFSKLKPTRRSLVPYTKTKTIFPH